MKKYIALLIVLFGWFFTAAQSVPRMLKIADELFENHRFLDAIEFYDRIVGLDKKNYRAKYNLGYCYLQSLQYKDAEETFFELGSDADPQNTFRAKALYKYATILKTNNAFKEADSLLAFVITISEDQELLKLVRKQKEGCVLALRQAGHDRGFTLTYMEDVNSKFHEFGAILNPSNHQMVFATTRNLGGTQYAGSQFDGVLPDLASFERVKSGWRNNSNAQRFDGLNSEWSEGSGTFTKDGTSFYFSSCQSDRGANCAIMVSYLIDDRWMDPIALNEYINEEGSENKQPTISTTGDTLFFSSDRSGGFGGSDIWMSLKGSEPESWGPAINLGDVINTTENDITPYYSSAFGCLLFSSNGHIGYGGYDIYAAKGESFFEPEIYNLGAPFNSSLDDTYFNISDTIGFVSSNREDRKSLHLYSFSLNDERLYLSLLISGESLIDSRIISRFRDVQSLDLFAFRVEDYEGYDLFAPEKRIKPKPSIIAAAERAAGDTTAIVAEKETRVATISSSERYLSGADQLIRSSELSIDYEHVYFAFGSSQLAEGVRKSLDDLVGQLDMQLVENIEVLAYTDIIGSEEYNQTLSEKRGKAVKDYLVKLGLPEEAIQIRARGEGPLSSNESWYSKMFSRRAEIIVNTFRPIRLEKARPYAVRYECTVDQAAKWLGLEKETLTRWNNFQSDTIKSGTVLRLKNVKIPPNILYFLEEKDIRNTFFSYKVKQRETLASIATKFKTYEELLMEINRIDGELKEGDEIVVYKFKQSD